MAPFELDERELAVLRRVAATALPSSLGERGVNRTLSQFLTWLRDYRSRAEMPHVAGRLDAPRTPIVELARYQAQLRALDDAGAGATPLRTILSNALADAGVHELPSRPDGRHVVSDFMSFYFRSSEANDLCYQVDIGRKTCRGLPGSGDAPRPLMGRD